MKEKFLARIAEIDKSITSEPSGISTCCKRLLKVQTEISSYTKNQGGRIKARATLKDLKMAFSAKSVVMYIVQRRFAGYLFWGGARCRGRTICNK